MNDDDQNAPSGGMRPDGGKNSSPGDKPYRVGKGKPPREHQWKKGCPSPNRRGRPKGRKRPTSLDKLLDTPVAVGVKNGRQIMKPLREAMDHRLVEQAVKDGNLRAIKLIYDIVHEQERLARSARPTADELARQREEEEEKAALAKKIRDGLIDTYNMLASMKKARIIEFVDGRPVVQPWVIKEAEARGFTRKRPAGPDSSPPRPTA